MIKVESTPGIPVPGVVKLEPWSCTRGKSKLSVPGAAAGWPGARANIKRSSPRAVGAVHLHCEPIYYSAILNRQRSRAELANIENGVRKAQRRTYAAYEDGTGSRHPSEGTAPDLHERIATNPLSYCTTARNVQRARARTTCAVEGRANEDLVVDYKVGVGACHVHSTRSQSHGANDSGGTLSAADTQSGQRDRASRINIDCARAPVDTDEQGGA